MAVFLKVGRGVPLDEAFALFVSLYDSSRTIADFYGASGSHFFTGSDEAPPVVGIAGVGADELDGAVVGKKAGGDDLGIVEDEEVIGRKEVLEFAEVVVGDFSGGAIDEHHARAGAIHQGAGGDQFLGEIVVEVSRAHVSGRVR